MFGCRSADPICLPYSLNNPDDITLLPSRLKEISGICHYGQHQVACIQDEKGIIFLYDYKKDKLRESIHFSKDCDYEAITNVGDTLYILCSKGELFKVWNLENTKPDLEIFQTPLTRENNCEGLCFDDKNQRLLIACKGRPLNNQLSSLREVYAFDLRKKVMLMKPVFSIDPEQVKKVLDHEGQSVDLVKETGEVLPFDFAPSEINLDPVNGNVYLLSSVGKSFVTLDATGNIICAIRLDRKIYRQPEGMTFRPNGDMLISDEGKDGRAALVVIKRSKTNNN